MLFLWKREWICGGNPMSELQMIWDEVVSMLELELNNIQLRNWIMPLDPISLSDYRLILDAKS